MKKPTNDKQFEVMVRDCAEMKYQKDFFLLGRKGQNQYGGDIASSDWETIIQCKCYDENKGQTSYKRLISSIKGTLAEIGAYELACKHFHKMKRFVVATTLDCDLPTQEEISSIEQEFGALEKKIPIQILFWEDLVPWYDAFEEKYKLKEIRRELDRELQTDRDCNPSFTLLKIEEIDRRLFPGFEDSDSLTILDAQTESDENEPISPVWERIRNTWNSKENRSIVIEGAGGIGKTVTLFSLTKARQDYSPAPAIYIPMHKLISRTGSCLSITSFLEAKFPYLYREIDLLARRKWNESPQLLLLLDGFNEIPYSHRRIILGEINDWRQAHTGAQLIAVSRPMDNLNLSVELCGNPIVIKLTPLRKEMARSYLATVGIDPPQDGANIWKSLTYPLFLVLYIKTGKIEKKTNSGYPLRLREANNDGSIIWNYLQRELLKQETEDWVIRASIVCEFILPRLAYRLLSSYRFTATQKEVEELTIDTLQQFDCVRLPSHLKEIWQKYQQYHPRRALQVSVATEKAQEDWCNAVLRDVGILVPFQELPAQDFEDGADQQYFSFQHQNFRDCLAGLYLVNQAEVSGEDEFPNIWGKHQSNLALNYASELIEPDVLDNIWESNRKAQQYQHSGSRRNPTATFNLLELYSRNEKLAKDLNFSGMDLRGLSLTNYLAMDRTTLPLFQNAAHSAGTAFDRMTFQSNGHIGNINVLAVLPDGCVVSGSEDHTLRVWDTISGQCLQTLEGHSKAVTCVAVLPDGRVVSGSDDSTLRVWDAASGQCLQTLEGHTQVITCVKVLAERRVVSGSKDCTLRVWDTATGQCLQTLEGHKSSVKCVAVLQNRRLVSGASDGTLLIWDSITGQRLHTLEGHIEEVFNLTVLPDGRVVSGSDDGTLRVWDAISGQCLQTLEGSKWVQCVAAFPDGRVVSSSYGYDLRVWDSFTGECLQTLDTQASHYLMSCVVALPDGRAVSGSNDHNLYVWDVSTGQLLKKLAGHSSRIGCVAILPDGRLISVCNNYESNDYTLRVWDATTGICLLTLGRKNAAITCSALLQDGNVICGAEDSVIRIWDYKKSKFTASLEGHSAAVTCIEVLKDGRVVSGSCDNTLRVWNQASGTTEQVLYGHTDQITCIVSLPGDRIASGSWDCTVRIWDIHSGCCLNVLHGHTDSVYCVDILPDGNVVSSSGDNTLRIWNTVSGQCLHKLFGHTNQIFKFVVLSNGWIVSASDDETLRVWDSITGRCLRVLKGHEYDVGTLIRLPNDLVVSGSGDGTIRTWDCVSGKCLKVMTVEDYVTSLAPASNKRILCDSGLECLGLWNPLTGKCQVEWTPAPYRVYTEIVIKNGQIVTGSGDRTIVLWEQDTGDRLNVIEATEVDVSKMDFSEAILSKDLANLLWNNNASISQEDYERWVVPSKRSRKKRSPPKKSFYFTSNDE